MNSLFVYTQHFIIGLLLSLLFVSGNSLIAQEPNIKEESFQADEQDKHPKADDPKADDPKDVAPKDADPKQNARNANAAKEKVKYSKAVIIEAHGVIDSLFEAVLQRNLETAKEMKADLIILEITSPGGDARICMELATQLSELREAHLVAYVPEYALSAGALISMGCAEIVMKPNARIGDAGPIIQGEDSLFRHAPEKIVSDLAREIHLIAESRDHPPILAEAMIDRKLLVYQLTHKKSGEMRLLSKAQLENLDNPDDWSKPKLVEESEENRFLTVSGKRAKELTLASANVNDLDELYQHFQLAESPRRLQFTWVDTTVWILNSPFITVLLFVVGLVSLYLELQFPGISVAGLMSALCFSLFFWSRFLGGTAGSLELILFFIGVICIVVEIFVIPGFGVFGFTGIITVGLSLILASQSVIIPESTLEWKTFVINMAVLVSSGVLFLTTASIFTRYLGVLPVFNRIMLTPPEPDVDTVDDDLLYKGLAVGHTGKATSSLRPSGKAKFGDQVLNVIAEDDFISHGASVEIIEMQGPKIIVKELENA